LKSLKASLDRKQIFVLDALRYSLALERHAFGQLTRKLRRIGDLPPTSRPSDALAISTLASAWLLIDILHRVRGLLRQVKGLPQKTPGVQVFLRGTSDAESFRHFFQHLDSSIAKLHGTSYPILGVLSWVTRDPAWSCSLTFGHWTKGTHSHSMVVDTHTTKFVASIQLDAGTSSLELARAHAAVRALSLFLEKWLQSANMLGDKVVAPSIMRFGIAFRTVA
jgi:hypothetical protein